MILRTKAQRATSVALPQRSRSDWFRVCADRIFALSYIRQGEYNNSFGKPIRLWEKEHYLMGVLRFLVVEDEKAAGSRLATIGGFPNHGAPFRYINPTRQRGASLTRRVGLLPIRAAI